MGENSNRTGAKPEATPLEAFLDALTTASERALRSVPGAADIASALAIAQLFPGVFAAAFDRQGQYRWVSNSYASVVGSTANGVVGRSLRDLFDPQ